VSLLDLGVEREHGLDGLALYLTLYVVCGDLHDHTREGENADKNLMLYTDPDSEQYKNMVNEICKELTFTSLMYQRLDDMLDAIDLDNDKLCTYCWNGKE